MKAIKKFGIFAAALMLSLIGFTLIASPSMDIMRIGKPAGTAVVADSQDLVQAAPVFIDVLG
jgi:hypothetical protein